MTDQQMEETTERADNKNANPKNNVLIEKLEKQLQSTKGKKGSKAYKKKKK